MEVSGRKTRSPLARPERSLLQGPLISVSVRQQVQNLLDSYPKEYLDLYRDHLRAVY